MGENEPRKETAQPNESILNREFVTPILVRAKEVIIQKGELGQAPLFLSLGDGQHIMLPLRLPPTHAEKRAWFTTLGENIRQVGYEIREALLVSDVWYVTPEEGEKSLEISPSQHPGRKEAIAIVGRDARGEHFTNFLQPYHRDGQNQLVFEPMVAEEYAVSSTEGLRSAGLVDFLFDPPDRKSVGVENPFRKL